jgi:hypothetical protein
MGIDSEISRLKSLPESASDSFRDQLQRMRSARERAGVQGGEATNSLQEKGIDRSRELKPVSRPTIVRTLAET